MKKALFRTLLILITFLMVESISWVALSSGLNGSNLSYSEQYQEYLFPSGKYDQESQEVFYHSVVEIHPFVGFYSQHFTLGHLGVELPHNPSEKNQNHFIIGISGGSVAANVAETLSQNKNLIERIQKWPLLKGKKVEFAIFAFWRNEAANNFSCHLFLSINSTC